MRVVVVPPLSEIHDHLPSPVLSEPTSLMTSQILPTPAIAVPPGWSLCIRSVVLCDAIPFLALPGASRLWNWLSLSTFDQSVWHLHHATISMLRRLTR